MRDFTIIITKFVMKKETSVELRTFAIGRGQVFAGKPELNGMVTE
jgi:hypothetical protein